MKEKRRKQWIHQKIKLRKIYIYSLRNNKKNKEEKELQKDTRD